MLPPHQTQRNNTGQGRKMAAAQTWKREDVCMCEWGGGIERERRKERTIERQRDGTRERYRETERENDTERQTTREIERQTDRERER